MVDSRPILRVGLTGAIAAGKSTVARILTELGAHVVDADHLAHVAIAPGGPGHAAVVERFGTDVLDADGRVARQRLAARVFGDPQERAALNAIVHPLVRAAFARGVAELESSGSARLAVFEAALLVETGAYRDFDRLVVVRCSPETQQQRLLKRGLDPAEARSRVAAQGSLSDKLAVADYVIDGDAPLDQTREQTQVVYAALLRDDAGR